MLPSGKDQGESFFEKDKNYEEQGRKVFFPLAGTFSSVSGYNFHHVHRFPFSLRESDTGEFLF